MMMITKILMMITMMIIVISNGAVVDFYNMLIIEGMALLIPLILIIITM